MAACYFWLMLGAVCDVVMTEAVESRMVSSGEQMVSSGEPDGKLWRAGW